MLFSFFNKWVGLSAFWNLHHSPAFTLPVCILELKKSQGLTNELSGKLQEVDDEKKSLEDARLSLEEAQRRLEESIKMEKEEREKIVWLFALL